jgi:hypothetical protein
MKHACNLAGVALIESVEVGLDDAFDDLDIVTAGHLLRPSTLIFQRSRIRNAESCFIEHMGLKADSVASIDIAGSAAKANELNCGID